MSMPFYTNNILVTGYWPPTNKMLRQFSNNTTLNPDGWRGRNWRGKGFDIYAYFPEFPDSADTSNDPGPGTGDLRVDYQDTLQDFTRFVRRHRPCAIVTFSRGGFGSDWEIERGCRNWSEWRGDYEEPHQPNPAPPDDSVPPEFWRPSTLPLEDIEEAVNDADHIDVRAWIDQTGDVGQFLSEYIGYLGLMYQYEQWRLARDYLCVAAGHIHVGKAVTVPDAAEATEITLEQLIKTVRKRLPTYWIANIGFRVRTKDAPHAGTDDTVWVELLRDNQLLAKGKLDFENFDDLERGDERFYGYTIPDLYRDKTPALPDGIGQIPMPYPNAGIEFSRGMQGHFKCRLRIDGDDMWIKDQVDIYVKETRLGGGGGDPRYWGIVDDWFKLGSWTQDVAMSTDDDEGEKTWVLGY
jgi:hypothetical protein